MFSEDLEVKAGKTVARLSNICDFNLIINDVRKPVVTYVFIWSKPTIVRGRVSH